MALQNRENAAGEAGAGPAVPPRAALRARRDALPPAARAEADAAIRACLAHWWAGIVAAGREPGIVAAYWPIGSEPDLRPWLSGLAGRPGLTLALPCIARRAAPLVFRAWQPGAPMAPGAFGIPEPVDGAIVAPSLLLVPTLGFSARADRVGYGGGYYDRTLAALRATGAPLLAVGVAYACGQLDAAHTPAAHDQRLDAIVTETGWLPAPPS